ncbi:S9 family peptidase [Thalassotalea mangrovi]|uniref:S9 family peptidase n=1 Tax=Thalassotalea mangrovi TaxID=2572245 RepID=A0A4U1B601_9GAMM|nr:S9 family peptidase [Thalassotalea mangrovi]TKB45929.1 S9 family peptidase [Thalassotalea mangrovi]
MRSFAKFSLGVALAATFASAPVLAQSTILQSETLTVEHLNNFRQLYDVKVSPDGRALVYGVKNGQQKGSNHLYLRDIQTGKVNQLTSNKASEHSVQWAQDSKGIYFLSSRSGSSQVWYLSLTGGEAQQLTDFALDVGGYKLAGDGKTIALAFDVKPGCKTLQCTVDAKKADAEQKHNTRAYDQLMVRHWDHWLDTFNTHLFIATLPDSGKLTEATDVMPEWNTDIAGISQVSFNPDASKLAFSAKAPGRDHAWTTNWDIFEVDLASNTMTNITEENKAWDAQPQYSSDGRYLAWKAMNTPVYESGKFGLKIKDLNSENVQDIAPLWDRSISDYHFSDDNRAVIAVAQDIGQKSIFSISLQFGDVTPILQDGTVANVSSAGKAIYFTRHTLDKPADVYTINKDGYGFKQLTDVNKDVLATLKMAEFKQFSFPGWNDEKVYGYWLKPANFESGKKYPIAFLVHGGPQGSFGNMFHYRWNAQLWAAQGYGVVMIDFHGSTGYGQQFTDSISGDWGGKPLEDLQKGLAYITEQESWLDADNACALGASYGGYMMNWFMGKWSDGFNCIVNHAGLFDMKSFYYSTEELWFPEHDFSGPYFQNVENYDKFDPSRFVDNWKMPMLVIQGELDYRVPYAQSLGAFTTLQRKGIDSRLVMFPDEDHHIRNPDNLKEWYREVFAWMDKYLKPQSAE